MWQVMLLVAYKSINDLIRRNLGKAACPAQARACGINVFSWVIDKSRTSDDGIHIILFFESKASLGNVYNACIRKRVH